MRFLKDLLRNLAILIGILIVIYMIYPDIMRQVFELYGHLFWPTGNCGAHRLCIASKKKNKISSVKDAC